MVNVELLDEAIEKSGLKRKYIAQEMGLTVHTFNNKAKNRSNFKDVEIPKLCKILKITDRKKRDAIFLL